MSNYVLPLSPANFPQINKTEKISGVSAFAAEELFGNMSDKHKNAKNGIQNLTQIT